MTYASTTRDWLKRYGRSTFCSWDFILAAVFGCLAFGLTFIDAVEDAAVPILIAEAATGVAITATVFGALAVFTTFYDGGYRRVLELSGGFRSALMPYIVVGVVSSAAALTGLLSALALPALGAWASACAVGIPTLFCAWTLAGTVSLVELTLFHATQRASLMAGADIAEQIRAQRLSQPTP